MALYPQTTLPTSNVQRPMTYIQTIPPKATKTKVQTLNRRDSQKPAALPFFPLLNAPQTPISDPKMQPTSPQEDRKMHRNIPPDGYFFTRPTCSSHLYSAWGCSRDSESALDYQSSTSDPYGQTHFAGPTPTPRHDSAPRRPQA